MPFITQPSPKLFPIRNRIIVSLAEGVLIIEATVKSGSLITAQEAANQSIDVMAIPSSPLDPRSAGTNSLIKDGAALVQNAQDVLAVLTSQTEVKMPDIKAYTIAERMFLGMRCIDLSVHIKNDRLFQWNHEENHNCHLSNSG